MSTHLRLQIKILLKYEKEDRFPSKIRYEDLQRVFPEAVDEGFPYSDPLTYAVKSLDEMGLLDVDQHPMDLDGADPPWFRTTSIRGLTPLGEEFLRCFRQAADSSLGDETMDRLKRELPGKFFDLIVSVSSAGIQSVLN